MEKQHFTFPTPFESPRLTLRSYQPGDGNWYYAMCLRNQAHLSQYESENAVMTITNLEAAEALVGEFAKDWKQGTCFFIGAFEKGTGEFVAQVYVGIVDQKLPEFEIGYFADGAHEGQGYVTEAVRATLRMIFNHLNAHRVRLECAETNLRSIRVAERCEMTREGRLRQNKRGPDGSFNNSLIYGLLKPEFQVGKNLETSPGVGGAEDRITSTLSLPEFERWPY